MIKNIALLALILCLSISKVSLADERFLLIEEVKTPGGLTAWLVTDETLPILSVNFVFEGAGTRNNSAEKQGVAKLLSNMLDEGAGELKSQEFQKQLTDKSISLSFSAGRDNFSGNLKTLTRYQDEAFSLLKLALSKPRFDPEPLERMRQANLTRIKSSLGNPNWITQRIFNDVAFEGHPYALNSGGTLTTLNSVTADDLRGYKNDYLTKDRLVIGVAGNITKDELTIILDKVFADIPIGKSDKNPTKLTLQNIGETFFYKKDIPQTTIIQALEALPVDDPDYPAQQVLNYIFGSGGFGSRLMTEAREKRGLTYGIYSSITNMNDINLLEVSTSTDNEKSTEMLNVIESEIDKLLKNIEDQEIKDAKSYLAGSLPLALSSTSGIANIVTSLQLNNRSIDYLDTYNDRIKKVTNDDLKRVAQRIFEDKTPVTVLVGQPIKNDNFNTVKDIPNAE